jgi:hypothetical protein
LAEASKRDREGEKACGKVGLSQYLLVTLLVVGDVEVEPFVAHVFDTVDGVAGVGVLVVLLDDGDASIEESTRRLTGSEKAEIPADANHGNSPDRSSIPKRFECKRSVVSHAVHHLGVRSAHSPSGVVPDDIDDVAGPVDAWRFGQPAF